MSRSGSLPEAIRVQDSAGKIVPRPSGSPPFATCAPLPVAKLRAAAGCEVARRRSRSCVAAAGRDPEGRATCLAGAADLCETEIITMHNLEAVPPAPDL